ncbi:MAG: peptidase M50, partial [Alphaproteobacteria bacterium]|nr:peptidase M50 [Alphaproteobacteria bacterium]
MLPPIRGELRLVGRSRDVAGHQVRVIYDPLRHCFFEMGPLAFEMLRRWGLGTADRLLAETRGATKADLAALLDFLDRNELLSRPRAARPTTTRLIPLLMSLLFFRVPLVRPDRALGVMAEALSFLFDARFVAVVAALGVAGLVLVVRQGADWSDAFARAFDPSGAWAIVAAVIGAKLIHELGHALAAKRRGCHVPSMGVAFMLGVPLPFTDLNDTWRLERAADRFSVAAGGMAAETMLAAFATWGWLLLPDGPARGACFHLASVGWFATLVVNLNPFLRFDGYYMLSDALGIPNLQERAFRMGRWALRRLALGWPVPPDEPGSAGLRLFLAAFAWATWVVRAIVFLGIAVAVYHLMAKALGVVMMALEVLLLVVGPMWRELRVWWRERAVWAGRPRGWAGLALLGGLVVWLVVPQSFGLDLPAVAGPAASVRVFPP